MSVFSLQHLRLYFGKVVRSNFFPRAPARWGYTPRGRERTVAQGGSCAGGEGRDGSPKPPAFFELGTLFNNVLQFIYDPIFGPHGPPSPEGTRAH